MSLANDTIQVNMAEAKIGKAPQVLESLGLGSCVAICLYDSRLKIGGMAHAMLPSVTTLTDADTNAEKRGENFSVAPRKFQRYSASYNPLRFADYAIDWMVGELKKLGSIPTNLEAKVVGGADMFEQAGENDPESIGDKTVEVVKEKLKGLGIKLKTADVGENVGRSVSFDLANGIVTVSTKM